MTVIRLKIFGQPVSKANSRQLVTIAGRPSLIKSKEALAYERDALRQIPAAARQRLEGPVRVTLHIWYASERPDLDESIILDVLQDRYKKAKGKLVKIADGEYAQQGEGERVLVQAGVYRNDRQVRERHTYHHIDRANPRAEIEIEPLAMQQQALPVDVPQQQPAVNPF